MRSLTLFITISMTTNAFIVLPHNFGKLSERRLADDEMIIGEDTVSALSDQQDLFASLKARQVALQNGIGKRYRVRTQKGFLNVHSSYEDGPYETENIVNQLVDGDIVTSIGPRVENWIQHDAGGWSIAIFGGFTWLEPLEDDDI